MTETTGLEPTGDLETCPHCGELLVFGEVTGTHVASDEDWAAGGSPATIEANMICSNRACPEKAED